MNTFQAQTPIYDWTKIPKKYNWIAEDSDGDLCAYIDKPEHSRNGTSWTSNSGYIMLNIKKHEIILLNKIHWMDTLEQRPAPVSNLIHDWRSIPEEYNYIAVDEEGEVYAYTSEPFIKPGAGRWSSRSASIFVKQFPKDVSFVETWKTTLQERPNLPCEPGYLYDWEFIDEKYKFATTDSDGEMYAYEHRPLPSEEGTFWRHSRPYKEGIGMASDELASRWSESLEERPARARTGTTGPVIPEPAPETKYHLTLTFQPHDAEQRSNCLIHSNMTEEEADSRLTTVNRYISSGLESKKPLLFHVLETTPPYASMGTLHLPYEYVSKCSIYLTKVKSSQ